MFSAQTIKVEATEGDSVVKNLVATDESFHFSGEMHIGGIFQDETSTPAFRNGNKAL